MQAVFYCSAIGILALLAQLDKAKRAYFFRGLAQNPGSCMGYYAQRAVWFLKKTRAAVLPQGRDCDASR